MTALPSIQIVHNRVDGFTSAYRVRLTDEVRVNLRRKAELAKVHGRAAVGVIGHDWELKPGSVPHVFHLRRDQHVRIKIDLQATGATLVSKTDARGDVVAELEAGWTVEIIYYAAYLAQRTPEEIIWESDAIAQALGKVHEARLRRLDLAADVAGWRVADRDRNAMVKRSRVRTATYPKRLAAGQLREIERDAPAEVTAHYTRKVTGLVLGRGDFMSRIYDKREELNQECSAHKRAAEEFRWRAGGWDGEAPMARVEFQLRGPVLRELGMRTLDSIHDPTTGECTTLTNHLPRVWATCLRWVRLVRRTRTRTGRMMPLSRCPEDYRWSELRKASWGDAPPITRVRERGGASSAQALGSMLSVVAARGQLEGTLPEDKRAWGDASSEKLKTLLATVAGWSVDLLAADMIERWGGAEDACIHLAVLWNAARARFARSYEREHVTWHKKSNQESTKVALSLVLDNGG